MELLGYFLLASANDLATDDNVDRHPDSFLESTDLGTKFPPYRPNFDFSGDYIDDFHSIIGASAKDAGLVNLDRTFGISIKGWLRRADALKLYELAYFAEGDILELGSFHGLSTCIMSRANHNSGARKHIYSVDLSDKNCAKTMASLQDTDLSSSVETICSDAATAVKRLADKGSRFSFVFIDHSHSYEPVYEVCQLLALVVTPAALCLFHDFNDRRNEDPNFPDYGVYHGVIDGLDPGLWEFVGTYGCTGLHRALF